jgi:hypothetical protein
MILGLIILWGLGSAVFGLTVAYTVGWLHRRCHRARRFEKPDLDIIFVTFTLVALPIAPFAAGAIEEKLTRIHVLEPVGVYADARGKNVIASLMAGDPVVFKTVETGKDFNVVRIRLPDGRDGYIVDHDRVEIVRPL